MRSTNRKKFGARSLVLALMLTAVVVGPQLAHADSCTAGGSGLSGSAGKTKAEASELNPSGAGVCVGAAETPEDWYKITFDTPSSFLLQFSLAGSTAVLYSPAAPTTPVQPTLGSGDQPGWSLHAQKGTWYLQIKAVVGVTGLQYEFHYAAKSQSDCGAPNGDASNTSAGAADFFAILNGACTGQIWGNADASVSHPPRADTDDWFLLPDLGAGSPQQFIVAATPDRLFGCSATTLGACGSPDGTGIKVEFRDSLGAVVPDDAGNPFNNAGDLQVALINWTQPKDGTYKMHLVSNGDYIYTISPKGVPPVAQAIASQVAGVQSTIANATNLASATAIATVTATASSVVNQIGDPGLLIPLAECGSPASGDAGNTSATATPLSPNLAPVSCTGKLGQATDKDDWYVFPVGADQQLTLAVSGDTRLDPNVTLYDPNSLIAFSGAAASPLPETFTQKVSLAGNWKLKVHDQANAGAYLLLLDVRTLPTDVSAVTSQVAGAQSAVASTIANVGKLVPSNIGVDAIKGDCLTANDAGNTSTNPYKIQANAACPGFLGIPSTDNDDWYSFVTGKDQTVTVVVQGETSLEQDAYLWNPAGQRVWPPSHFNTPAPEVFSYTIKTAGTWKIQVHRVRGGGRYLFLMGNANAAASAVPTIPATPDVSKAASPDCGSGTDAPNAGGVYARPITPPVECIGTLGVPATDTEDWFSFQATVGNHIIVQEQAEASLDADVFVYGPLGDRTPSGPGNVGVTPETIYMYANKSGTHQLRIHKAFGSGRYTFSLYVGT